MVGITTKQAMELRLRTAITTVHKTTTRALLTRVARVHQNHPDARQACFVGNELSQLMERPIAMSRPLVSTLSPGPRANAGQVLQPNRPVRALCLFNETLADPMIGVFLKPSLATGQFPQVAFRRQCPPLLQSGTKSLHLSAIVFNPLAGMTFAVAVHREVRNPQVHPESTFGFLCGRFRDFTHRQQVKRLLSLAVDQIAFALLVLQKASLTFARLIGDGQPATHRPDRDNLPVGAPAKNAVIIGNGPVRTELAFCPLVPLIGIGHLAVAANDHLGGQSRTSTHLLIAGFLELERAKDPGLPGQLAHGVTQSVGLFKGLRERLRLFRRGKEFDLSNEFHRTIVPNCGYPTVGLKPLKRGVSSCQAGGLPRLKASYCDAETEESQ